LIDLVRLKQFEVCGANKGDHALSKARCFSHHQ
jgi:hypothetical protein